MRWYKWNIHSKRKILDIVDNIATLKCGHLEKIGPFSGKPPKTAECSFCLKKGAPNLVFDTLGEMYSFLFDNHKFLLKDEAVSDGAKLTFTDGSYVTIYYRESFTSESGTWWPGDLEIYYYAKK